MKKTLGRKWAAAAMALAAGVMTARAVEPVLDNLPGAPGQSRAYWEAVRAEAAAKKAAAAAKAASTATATAETAQAGGDFFTGKPYDADLGGYVFKYRTYDPHLGRWTTPDPSGFPDGANGYAYGGNARNSPSVFVDPLGLEGVRVDAVAWVVAHYTAPAIADGYLVTKEDYGHFLAVQQAVAAHSENMRLHDRNSAREGVPTHYLDDSDVFYASQVTEISQLGNFNENTMVYVFAHGVFNINLPGDPFMGYGVGTSIYQAQDFYNIGANIKWVMGCTEYNNGDGNCTTQDIINHILGPTFNDLYE